MEYDNAEQDIAFGPVPSRRLGRSVGINNIPPKACTYACCYCQVGGTQALTAHRQVFYDPARVVGATREKVSSAEERGEHIDFLTFVPDGEPTLDINLGRELWDLNSLGIPLAVITNGSLLWDEAVRVDLCGADWVSIKVDTVDPDTWVRLNRPHRTLHLHSVLDGIVEFARRFPGELAVETMLVDGVNDDPGAVNETAEFIASLHPLTSYISIPTRPPAVASVRPPNEQALTAAFETFREHLEAVELLTGYEGDEFASTGDPARDLLAILAVHPMKRAAVNEFLASAHERWELVDTLISRGMVAETTYRGATFYVRPVAHG